MVNSSSLPQKLKRSTRTRVPPLAYWCNQTKQQVHSTGILPLRCLMAIAPVSLQSARCLRRSYLPIYMQQDGRVADGFPDLVFGEAPKATAAKSALTKAASSKAAAKAKPLPTQPVAAKATGVKAAKPADRHTANSTLTGETPGAAGRRARKLLKRKRPPDRRTAGAPGSRAGGGCHTTWIWAMSPVPVAQLRALQCMPHPQPAQHLPGVHRC